MYMFFHILRIITYSNNKSWNISKATTNVSSFIS